MNRLLIILLFFCITLASQAQTVNPTEATSIGQNFMGYITPPLISMIKTTVV